MKALLLEYSLVYHMFLVVVLLAMSCLTLATLWTIARQSPLSMGFPRQEYWSGLPFPSPADLSDPGIKPKSPALAGGFFTTELPGKPIYSLSLINLKCVLYKILFSNCILRAAKTLQLPYQDFFCKSNIHTNCFWAEGIDGGIMP